MRRCPLLVLGALVAPAFAQNNLVIYPEDTGTSSTYVGRPSWNAAAEGFIEVPRDWFRAVGEGAGGCFVDGLYHWAADENITTAETYSVVLRRADAAGALDVTAAGVIARVGPLTTPTRAGTRASSIIRDVFATPVQVPCDRTWFHGIDFPANPNWPATDGHALWRADVNPPAGRGVGENPRPGYPWDIAWVNDFSGTILARKETYILGSIVTPPVLQVGGIDPGSCLNGPGKCGTANYGLGGLFPEVVGPARRDGIDLLVRSSATPGGIAWGLLGLRWFGTPLRIPGIAGSLVLDPTIVILTVGSTPLPAGSGTIPVFAPGTIPPSGAGVLLAFQGLVIGATGTFTFTNGQATRL